jgi:precorrin-2 dehydrogenase / sirohydrochlorin ferrochelatase
MSAGDARPYAVMLAVARKLVTVVGNTPAAVRAAKGLAAHGADVVVITPDATPELLAMESDGELTIETRAYARGDLAEAFLAVVATGSYATDAAAIEEARAIGALLYVPADADASDFIVPSVVRRGAVQIAVTTGGGAPSVAREIRRGIAEAYGPEWDAYATLMAGLRKYAIEHTGCSDGDLAPLFEAVDGAEVRRLIALGRSFTAKELFEEHRGALDVSAPSGMPESPES